MGPGTWLNEQTTPVGRSEPRDRMDAVIGYVVLHLDVLRPGRAHSRGFPHASGTFTAFRRARK
jgi:hypothetical protein